MANACATQAEADALIVVETMHVDGKTLEDRSSETRAYAVLNDSEQAVSGNVLAPMRNYDVRPIPWSARDEALGELAA